MNLPLRAPILERWPAVVSAGTSRRLAYSRRRAPAQIKQPGAHGLYSVEVEPHAALWWRDRSHDYCYNGSGWGLGMRASTPSWTTGVDPVFFAGGRVGNESLSFAVRVDWPYASVGASFFL